MPTVSMNKLQKMFTLEETASQLFASLTPAAKKIYAAAYPGSKLLTADTMPEMQDGFQQETAPATKGGGGDDIDLGNPNPNDGGVRCAKKGGGGEDVDLNNPNPNDGSGSNVASLASRERLVRMVRNEAAAALSFRALSAVERNIYLKANPASRFAGGLKKIITAAIEKPPTHTGMLVGVRPGYEKSRIPVDLHETKNAYHAKKMGFKYRKDSGRQMGDDFPTHRLDLTSVKPRT